MDRAHGCGESSTRQRRPLYVTGSSSKMLSAEIPSGFRGRALELGLLPFSFAESCLRGGEVIGESGLVGVPAAVRARMERHLDSYLEQGGVRPHAVFPGSRRSCCFSPIGAAEKAPGDA